MNPRRPSASAATTSLLLLAFLYLPLGIVVLHSFNNAPHGGPWKEFTTRWYGSLWNNGVALDAARTTLLLAAGSTVVSTALGTLLALGLAGARFPGRRAVENALIVPMVLPDIVMAVALLLCFHTLREAAGWLAPGLGTMILAHVTFQIPFVTLVVRARLTGFDPALAEAAGDLGATRWQVFRHVRLPLLWPGILAGALLAFTLSLDDFVVSFFTGGPGATPLPVLIYSSVKRGITPEINAISSMFIGVSIMVTVVVSSLQKGRKDF